jgi:hypothetical protein
VLTRKVAALAAHRTQYALDADLFPLQVLERLLGTEHFEIAAVPRRPARRGSRRLAATRSTGAPAAV